MIVLLQLILCLLSGVCFGMEQEKKEPFCWGRYDLSYPVGYPYGVTQGKLQIYYVKSNNDTYQRTVRFIPNNDSKMIIKMSQFSDECHKKNFNYQKYFENQRSMGVNLLSPMHISHDHNKITINALRAEIEKRRESEELDISGLKFFAQCDTSLFDIYEYEGHQYKICKHDYIDDIWSELSWVRGHAFWLYFSNKECGGEWWCAPQGSFIWKKSGSLNVGIEIPVDLSVIGRRYEDRCRQSEERLWRDKLIFQRLMVVVAAIMISFLTTN